MNMLFTSSVVVFMSNGLDGKEYVRQFFIYCVEHFVSRDPSLLFLCLPFVHHDVQNLTLVAPLILEACYHFFLQNAYEDDEFVIMVSFLLFFYAVYLFLLRSNISTRLELRHIYKQDVCHLSLDKASLKRIIEETIGSLGLDMKQSSVTQIINTLISHDIRSPQDVALVVEELSASASLCKGLAQRSCALSPKEYRDLSSQLMANILKEGVDSEEDGVQNDYTHRTVSMGSFGVAKAIVTKWAMAPKDFGMTLIVTVLFASIVPLQSTFLGSIIDGIDSGDSNKVRVGIIVWGSLLGVSSIADIALATLVAKLNGNAMNVCRKRVFSVILAGGIEFFDFFPPTSTIDTYTTQMAKVEMTLISATYTLLLSVLQLTMGVIFAFRLNWLVGFTFITVLPIVYSIDKLVKLSLKSSVVSTSLEGRTNEKFISMINCLPVIRSCGVSTWACSEFSRLIDEFSSGKIQSIRMSNYVQSYYQVCGNIYTLLW